MLRHGWRLVSVVLLGALVTLAGCGGADDDENPRVRLVNASSGYASLDLYLDDSLVSSAIATGSASGYSTPDEGDHTVVLTRNGSGTSLQSQTLSLSKSTSTTVIAYGWEGALKTVRLDENEDAASSGKTKLLVLNAATSDVSSVDVYLTGNDDDLDSSTPVASSVSDVSGSYTSVGSGTYRLRVTAAGDSSDVRLDLSGVSLASTAVQTLVLRAGSGGTLLDGLMIAQQGDVTALANTQARLRVVAAASSNALVSASFNGTSVASSAKSPTIGSYARVTAGSAAPTVTVNGSTLGMSSQQLAAGGDYTLLVWGSATAPQTTLITDDNRLPSTSTAKMRLIHAMSDLSDTLSLTLDYADIASNLAQGSASSYKGSLAASSSARIDVTTPTQSAAIYNATDTTIAAKGVYTVFMFGSSSAPVGVLRKER